MRPVLEADYVVEETVGLALLPSETHVSRRSFFGGKPPAAMPPSGKESDFFAECLDRIHGTKTRFEDLPRRPGMAFGVRSQDDRTWACVFDFADVLSHEVNWDPSTLQEALRPLLREVQAVLSQAGPEALVFVTADHGHIRHEGSPVPIRGTDGVGYRSAYVEHRVEGAAAAHLFQIPARTLRHSRTGWFVFPRPGFALRDDQDPRRFKPGAAYRHGGMSLFEMVVPLACLKHREARTQVRLVGKPPESVTVGVPTHLQVSVSTDGVISSPVTIRSDDRDVEPVVLTGVEAVPRTITMRFTPSAPGKRTIHLSAGLAEQEVGGADVEVNVAPAPAARDEAREKLARLFGEE